MSTNDEDVQARASEIADGLRTLKANGKHQNDEIFSRLYPVIVEMLAQKVSQKAILTKLEETGLKLHASRFKQLMAACASKVPALPEKN